MTPARVVNFIPQGVITIVIPAHGHDTVTGGKHGRNTLTATACGHGISYHGIKIVMVNSPLDALYINSLTPFHWPSFGIKAFADLDGLVRTCGVDFKRCLTVHPVVGAAETCSFRAYHTHMAGCKGLAEGAGVKGIHIFVSSSFPHAHPWPCIQPWPFLSAYQHRLYWCKG